MIGTLGAPEFLVIVVVALRPSKIPDFGKSPGEAIRGFNKALNDTGNAPGESPPTPKRPPHTVNS
jgi:Sec-independent protein translocase protein TatA